ncbi:hypothetical protein [Lacticaseibacillus sharpeae]|nr:hypothetical protein [Lacticaseibacillus sharpeae]
MDDKVIFPGTWSESLVKRWKRQFLDAFLKDSNVPLTLSEGCWSTPVAPLRKLYIENRDSFVKLTQLFRLFGIEVHVKNGQGLFGDWQWNTSWQVVVSASAVQNWQILNDMVTHSPILRTIPFLRELVSEQRLEGLVIDQLKSFNALMDVQQLHKDFSRMGIEIEYVQALAPGSILLTNEDSKKNKHINKAQTLVDVFGEKNTWLINRFKEFDMTKLDDVTIGKLGLVFQSKGIGPGKINKIQQLLIQSGMSESEVSFGYTKEKDSSLENNTPYVLSVLKASDLAKVTPRGLSSLRDGHVRGAWLVQDVLKYFSEMATNIPDWEVYSSILPMGKKLYESMTDKHAPNVMSLRLYVLLLGCVWTLKKRQREKFEPIVSRGSHLDEVGSWNLVVNDEFNQDAAKKIMADFIIKLATRDQVLLK